MGARILVVDDDPDFTKGMARAFGGDYQVDFASSGGACIGLVEQRSFDLVLLDLKLPDMGGLAVLRQVRERGHDVPVVIMTAYGGVDSAVSAIRLGAVDYVEKPFEIEGLKGLLNDSLTRRDRVSETTIRQHIVGASERMRAVWRAVEIYAPTDLPILLQGETGTGKGVWARAIHDLGGRADGPFVRIDCAGLAEGLFDSELFGHEKGAFTGAVQDKPGRVRWADGGTLFLDDITETLPSSQAKLLRFLEDRTVTTVGAKRPPGKPLNVRFVSATNRRLEDVIEDNRFRADLFYRLAGVTIELPPLRERGTDLKRLARHFVRSYRSTYCKPALDLSRETLEILEAHSWPGNVRELEHVIEAAAVAADTLILPCHLPSFLRRSVPAGAAKGAGAGPQVRIEASLACDLSHPVDLKKVKAWIAHQAEMQVIAAARRSCDGNRGELAAFLGIDPKTLRMRLRQLKKEGVAG